MEPEADDINDALNYDYISQAVMYIAQSRHLNQETSPAQFSMLCVQ